MSLFLGNLSSRIRHEELERVFRRYGRSNIQLKDGYGFVVYDIAANAERALRALRGKNICGEQISLTWANNQPRPFKRFPRTNTRFPQPYRGRNFKREEDGGLRNRGSQDLVEFTTGTKHPNNNHEGLDKVVMLDKEMGCDLEDMKDRGEEVQKSHVGMAERKPLENDRWGEPNGDSLNDLDAENGTDFDRYEPYHGYDGRNANENHQRNGSSGSAHGSSAERARRELSGDTTWKYTHNFKPQQVCYICGLVGHIRRNCPRSEARRDKFSRFDHRRGEINFKGRGEREVKRLRFTSWGRHDSNRDHVLSRRHVSGRKASGSGKLKISDKRKESFSVSNKKHHSRIRKDSQVKERSRREPEASKKCLKKKARRSSSSLWGSDSTALSSRSLSPSSKSLSGTSSSCSRSVSSRSHSVSSSSRSGSIPSYSKSRSSRSRSRSTSLRSSPLSISPIQQLPTTLTTGSCENAANPGSKYALPEQKPLEVGTCPEKLEVKDKNPTPEDKNRLFSFRMNDGENQESPGLGDGNDNYATSGIRNEEKRSCSVPLEIGVSTGSMPSLENVKQGSNLETPDPVVRELISVVSPGSNSLSISPQELLMTLKRYGFPVPEEGSICLSVDAYFGAARMWPWEMVYYRRLKKGPISTENYARRLSQNREFGIVDKYVRSSSGWAECDHGDA